MRRLDGLLNDLGVLLVVRARAGRVNGFTGDLVAVLVDGTVARRIDGAVGDANFLSVGRLDARTVFTLDHVNWGVVVSVMSVNLNTSLCV